MVRTKLKMNSELKVAFSQVKPVCDVLMVYPCMKSLTSYSEQVGGLKREVVQELQQYLLYPLISRIKCNEIRQDTDLHLKILDALRAILEKVTVNSYEMYMKMETGLLSLIFDSTKKGMVAEVSEEVKYNTVRCLTVLMLNIPHEFRIKVLKKHVPMLAQAVFVAVHIAKMERLRILRVEAIKCVMAHTMTHPQLTVDYRIADSELELLTVDNLLSTILPGVLGALQDVCTCVDNPNHAVITVAVEAIHRILCLSMHDKYNAKSPVTTADFVNMLTEKKAKCDTDVSSKVEKCPKDMVKRSTEWFEMAGDKLTLITKRLIALRLNDHFKVRKELAIYCYRILTECSTTMTKSVTPCLEVLIALSRDTYPEVANYCSTAISTYFANAPEHSRLKTMDSICDGFVTLCISIPRLLNSIESSRKLSALQLLDGYLRVLSAGRPQRLTGAVSVAATMHHLCTALAAAATHAAPAVPLASLADRDLLTPPPLSSPWSVFRNLESKECIIQLQEICALLGGTECAELVLDVLLDGFQHKRESETVFILNWMISSPESTASMAKRMLYAYIDHDTWYLPLKLNYTEAAATSEETYDVTVYNPRAWHKEVVPDLYEGQIESRYTDLSLQTPREARPADPRYCGSPAEAHDNLLLSCLLTEGVAVIARRVRAGYQPYLLKTLCLILERVGSEYEMLHLAGLKAINAIAAACGHGSVTELIYHNADYFINQITVRLKKEWHCQSALQILSVVLEYSDASILDFLYDIVEDVLVQSCDKYYEHDLAAYLQAYLTFVERIRVWFPPKETARGMAATEQIDLLAEVREYVKDTHEAERLLSDTDFEKSCGKTVEEMYKEDLKKREEEMLNYDDSVTNEKQPLPQYVVVTITILKRSIHFITSRDRNVSLLSLLILQQGLPLLASYEDELLPIVHEAWAPLVSKFQSKDPVVLRRSFDLLIILAELAKDFIQSRVLKEVLPEVYRYLRSSSKDSYLKDAGSAYRNSLAYSLQLRALEALPGLAVDLGLCDERLTEAMSCVQIYLSNKQPKPLQAIAVRFFKDMVDYEYPAAWYHLKKFCNNGIVLEPPTLKYIPLQRVVGVPHHHTDKEFEANVNIIYDFMVS